LRVLISLFPLQLYAEILKIKNLTARRGKGPRNKEQGTRLKDKAQGSSLISQADKFLSFIP
jgi:hypothetical protein